MLHRSPPSPVGGPFELVDAATGRQITAQSFPGKWLLVFFGYTHCPDVCPTTLSNMADAMTEVGPLAAQVQPLFITVDPDRDTPAVLVDYTAAFDPRIVGLSGTATQIAAAAKDYRVYYAKRVIGDDYFMDHTSAIHVMRPDGTPAAIFLPTAGPDDMARQIAQADPTRGNVRVNALQEEEMSGKKKPYRKSVLLVTSRRGRGRRRLPPRIARRATTAMMISLGIAVTLGIALAVFVEPWPHHDALTSLQHSDEKR
jgi:protein SCO1/2